MNCWTANQIVQNKCTLSLCQCQNLLYMTLHLSWSSCCVFCRGLSTRQASTRRSQLLYHSLRNWTWLRSCPPQETIPMATGIKLYRNLPKVFHVITSKPHLLSSLKLNSCCSLFHSFKKWSHKKNQKCTCTCFNVLLVEDYIHSIWQYIQFQNDHCGYTFHYIFLCTDLSQTLSNKILQWY